MWLYAHYLKKERENNKERKQQKKKTQTTTRSASLISLWRLQILFLSLILFVEVSRPYFSSFHSFRLFFPHETDDYGFFLSEVVEEIRP